VRLVARLTISKFTTHSRPRAARRAANSEHIFGGDFFSHHEKNDDRKQGAKIVNFEQLSQFSRLWTGQFAPIQPFSTLARRALLLLLRLLYRGMLASFLGDGGTAVFARHALVSAFDFHRRVSKDAVCWRDFTVRQSTRDQSL
jgi:hypothetical protein